MKHLASLTTFFITLLFVVYLGLFAGINVNGFIANKKVVIADALPSPLLSPMPSSSEEAFPKASASQLAQVPPAQAKATSQPKISQQPVTQTTAVPVIPSPVDTQTPPPAADPTQAPTQEQVPQPTEPPAPLPDPQCIITISGSQYDVTEYRNIHSGGNVFSCGQDMTAVFLSQHPASFLDKMAKYKI